MAVNCGKVEIESASAASEARGPERAPSAGPWLPYAASALVTIAAIFSAWPLYLLSFFPYLALSLVIIGTPTSMYLRAVGAGRRLLNITIIGLGLIFTYTMLDRMPLQAAGSNLVQVALSVDDRQAMAFVVHMFVTVAMFRSFLLLTDRDLTLTIVPALSTILLASITVAGAWVVVSLLLFLLGALYLLAFDHQQLLARQVQGGRLLAPGRRRSLLATAIAAMWLVCVPAIFAAAIVFGYINVPRMVMLRYRNYLSYAAVNWVLRVAAPIWIEPVGSLRLGSGLPQGREIMFWVASLDNALWRCTTLDVYTGEGWQRSRWERYEPLARRGSQCLVPARDFGTIAGVPGTDLRQTFRLAVPMQGLLVGAYEPRAIIGPVVRARVSGASVLTNLPMRGGTIYTVISRRKQPPGAAVYRAGVELPPDQCARYLALPSIPERTRRLALRIARPERDDLHRALALRAYLESKYVYRERVKPPPDDRDAVDYFLFHMDGGYCDYFSSALAVLARLDGIPARVVTGYRSDEEDERTGEWVVRQKHAHSWVEVFLKGYGWLELDPSPSPGRQPSLLEQMQKTFASAGRRIKRALAAPFHALLATPGWWWKSAAGLAALVLAAMGVVALRRERVPPLPRIGRDLHEVAELSAYVRRAYRRMCEWLAKWGWPKPAGATATEYGLLLARDLGADAEPMRQVIGAYLAAEYGGRRVQAAQARDVRLRLLAILARRKALLRRNGGWPADGPGD
jgi:transglutaminase-like putative cysteine protease